MKDVIAGPTVSDEDQMIATATNKKPRGSIRLGLCCMFRDEPIKFVTTTATAIGKYETAGRLAKLSRLCLANADALLASLRFCAENGIGCFRINSQILPIKTHPDCGYDRRSARQATRSFAGSRSADSSPASTTCGPAFIPISSWC